MLPEFHWTKQQEKLISTAYADLLDSLDSLTEPEERKLVARAFDLANEAHKGALRKSSEPYILHPIAVAKITGQLLPGDAEAVACALLHDVVEDTPYTCQDIERIFGPTVAQIVEGLTKIDTIAADGESRQVINYQQLVMSIEKDFRTIIIKLADRLHNMRTLSSMREDKQLKIASETIYFYAPIAERIGLYGVKTELEDLSFKYRHPKAYQEIARRYNLSFDQAQRQIDAFSLPIRRLLTDSGVDYQLSSRPKSIYSIWRKMQNKQVSFDEIYDLLAVRIVFRPIEGVPESTQCWFVYSLLTDLYTPLQERTRDWVTSPKVNGYEALHCTLLSKQGRWVEVQIRTVRMNEIAERGLAAHWKYKDHRSDGTSALIDRFRAEIDHLHSTPHESATEFVSTIQSSILTPQVMAYTQAGVPYSVSRGATALDFAYQVDAHTANKAIGVIIDGLYFPFNYVLQGGEKVELLTADSQAPSPKWVDFVKTPYAKNCIRISLAAQGQELVKRGRTRVETICARLGVKCSTVRLRQLLPLFDLSDVDEFYRGVALGTINLDYLKRSIRRQAWRVRWSVLWHLGLRRVRLFFLGRRSAGWRAPSLGQGQAASLAKRIRPGVEIVQALCCCPLPGDDIVAYQESPEQVVMHLATCNEAIRLMAQHGDQVLGMTWEAQQDRTYLAHFHLEGDDRRGILADLFSRITDVLSIDICRVDMQSANRHFEGQISVWVHSSSELFQLIANIQNIRGIRRVIRMEDV